MHARLRTFSALLLFGLAPLAMATTISVELPVDTRGAASQPQLSHGADGSVMLSWIETLEDGSTELRAARMGSRKWNDPVTLARGDNWFVNWADLPKVCSARDGRLIYGWLEELGEDKYAYGIRFGVSDAKGFTRREPRWLHDDRSPSEHGFVSFAPVGVDRAWAVWLDGRRFVDAQTAFGEPIPRTEEMQLRAALLATDGSKFREFLIDARTCECCPTSLVAGDAGVFVAYRDRSPDEIRNISVCRLEGQRFSEPVHVYDDQWKVPGCPVNGPSLALQDGRLAIAWFTSPGDVPQVRFARGDVENLQFDEPLQIDPRKAMGRVDLEMEADGTAHLVWMRSESAEKASLMWTQIGLDGSMSEPEVVTTLDAARYSGMPQLALIEDAAIVVWTERRDERLQIRCLQLRQSAGS